MNYKEFNWCGYKWISQERWGDCHQDKPYAIYDGNMIQFNKDNSIALHVSRCGKTNPYSVGLMSCTEHFTYGTFELDVKFPKGNNLWPAFWTWSFDSWPPEIDIFEGYSESDKYGRWKIMHDIRPCIHIGDNEETRKSLGSHKTLALASINPTENYIHFTCKYTPKSISIFYNHIPVHIERSKEAMKWFNKHPEQNVIINTMVRKEFTDADLKDMSPMVVKNFKYTPLK